MTQEEKELLLKDICGRLHYGVKVLCEGWDSDHGCEFNTVEDLVGIDDKFIHTLWRGERDKHSIVEPLSIMDYKPYLRPLPSMTEKEKDEFLLFFPFCRGNMYFDVKNACVEVFECPHKITLYPFWDNVRLINWLNKNMFDYRGLIEKGLALEAPEVMYNN